MIFLPLLYDLDRHTEEYYYYCYYYYYYFQFCYHQIITWNSIQYLHIEKGNHAFQFSVSGFR